MRKSQWKDLVTLIAGVVLVAAPWTLDQADETTRMFYNAVAVGFTIALASVTNLLVSTERLEPPVVKFLVGLWAVASPWVLGFATQRDMMISTVAVGVVVAVVSLRQLADRYDLTDRLPQ